jgi:hypothetical protein
LAAARDGRLAVYHGRRIQFFHDRKAASTNASIVAQGSAGVFSQMLWNDAGTLLGAVFKSGEGPSRLETWKTSKNFPPECVALPPLDLDGESFVPANRGMLCIGRSARRGIFQLDPETGSQTILDASSMARQNAAMAASSDGRFLAMVTDRTTVRLLRLPEGTFFAELPVDRLSQLSILCWDDSGRHLAGVTEDGRVHAWNLAPWQNWLAQHALEK